MIVIGKDIVSDDLEEIHFICNLKKCKGACCVDGDAGAPYEIDEISILEDDIEKIKPYMDPRGIRIVEEQGVFDYDAFGEMVTPLINDEECAFAVFDEKGTAFCAIERAWKDKKTSLHKPLSCHLYPIRIKKYDNYHAVNYHKWNICQHALVTGKRKGVPLYVFCKDALIRKFGEKWYRQLCRVLR